MNLIKRCLLIASLLLLASCDSIPARGTAARDNMLADYGAAIRWNEFEKAQAFIDPVVRQQQPMTGLESERLKQIQVTGYEVKTREVAEDGSIVQSVEIRVVNRNTQIERIVIDRQTWRTDASGKGYWLVSGLPDFSAQ